MDSPSGSSLPTLKTVLSAAGSIAATAMLLRGFTQEFLPPELQDYISCTVRNALARFSNQMTMVVDEFDGLANNEIYQAAEVYLRPKISPTTRRLKVSKTEKEKHLNIAMERGEEVLDVYNGVKLKWFWICNQSCYNPRDTNSTVTSETRSFQLTFHYKHKDLVVNSYLPYIVDEARKMKQEKKTVKIFTVDYDSMYGMNDLWIPVTLDHPATFETLAMDSERKEMILKDLERFVSRKEYYRKVGKTWKRGYLLYGPPGTGKSSLIAAMANYLNFDVYDLELTEIKRNSDLRKLLVTTANKSILVVEDIDCTIDLQEKLASREASNPGFYYQDDESKVTLSGLLNFMDGLWSSCGDERIMIFTTNHIEKLDPALLRPGRMDVHINLSYCTPCGFRLLASNYLRIKEHSLLGEIEDLIGNAKATPAEVAEQLLKDENHDASLRGLVDFLHNKRKENEEAEAEKAKKEAEAAGKVENADNVETKQTSEEKVEGQSHITC